jgi:undecaprenyl-phosphate galactose phosphotransferase
MLDLAAYFLALKLAVVTRSLADILFPEITSFGFSYGYFVKLWWMPAIIVMLIAYKGLYHKRLTLMDETKALLGSVTFSFTIIFALVSIARMTDMVSRMTIIFIWFYSMLLFPLFRRCGRRIFYSLDIGRESILVTGICPKAIETASAILRERNYGYKLKGFFSPEGGERVEIKGTFYPVFSGDIEAALEGVPTVVFVENGSNHDEISRLIQLVRRKASSLIIVPDAGAPVMMNSEFHYLFNDKLFLLRSRNNLTSKANMLAKRVFDIVFTLAVLPFAGLLMLLAAIAILLESRGSVFYSHTRVGRQGKPISVLKMRSMYMDADHRLEEILKKDPAKAAEWQAGRKLKDDPRVTKVGGIIRKASIDELPQFINVLLGDMSVVGPRPIVTQELTDHYGSDGYYYLSVRPGITGLWQVSGRSDTDYAYRVGLDSWYVMNWSIWLDLMIIIKTLKAVINKEGAY